MSDPRPNELKRKLFHLLGLVYVLLYTLLQRSVCLEVMEGLGVVILLLEGLRQRFPAINRWGWEYMRELARPWEKRRMSGVFWTWLGSFLTVLVFTRRDVVLTALGFMIFGDAAAALVGQRWGRHFWPGRPSKSIEGTAAFAVAAVIWGCWFFPFPVALITALAAAWLESRRLPWDDNLWITLASAASLTALIRILH